MQVKQSYDDERNHRVAKKVSDPKALVYTNEDNLKNFQPDEERAEKTEDQKEDMNKYLTKLNRKIEALITAHADAEKKIVTQVDSRNLDKNAIERRQAIQNGLSPSKRAIT